MTSPDMKRPPAGTGGTGKAGGRRMVIGATHAKQSYPSGRVARKPNEAHGFAHSARASLIQQAANRQGAGVTTPGKQ